MARFDEPLLTSRPCRVVFAGWETTTSRLQQAGWQLSAEQNVYSGRLGLIMQYAPCRLRMLAEAQDFDFFSYRAQHDGDRPTFLISRVFSDAQVVLSGFDFTKFGPIDAIPTMSMEKRSLDDYKLFATPLARTEEIIVAPDTVSELMEKIRKLQQPELAEIRERNRRRAADPGSTAPIQAQNFHAQIVSLAA